VRLSIYNSMTLPLHFCLSLFLSSSESRTLHCIISRRRSWGWSRSEAPDPASPCPHAEAFPCPAWCRRSWGSSRPEAPDPASPCPHTEASPRPAWSRRSWGCSPPRGAGACRRSPVEFRTLHCMVSRRRSWGWSRPEARPHASPCPHAGSFPLPSLEPAHLGLELARRSRSLPAPATLWSLER
jgi:hypothetical protein